MPVNIKGKEYVTVAERMEGMRQSGKPFEIVESMPIQIGDRCVWRVAIMLDGCKFYGSAEAHFNAKAGSADATDPFACAETSAIGRALGSAGYGSVDSIASADEITRTNAPAPQPKPTIAAVPDAPTDILNLKQLIISVRNRAYKLGTFHTIGDYERYCSEIIGKPAPETVADVNRLNQDMATREKKAS